MNKDLNMNMIPDQLNITIRTSIPGYQKIEYKPQMSIKNTEEKTVKFNPLIKLNKSIIDKIPEEYRIKEFFNKGLFESMLNYNNGKPATNLIHAKRNGYIDNNIKVTLDTIFPTNSVIYIGKNPYVIGDVQWTTGDWKMDLKYKKLDIDITKIRDPRLYGELVKDEIISGEKQLNEFPKEVLTGNNYNGPPVVARGIEKEPETKEPETKEPETKQPEIKQPETKEPETKEPEIKQPENQELVKYKPTVKPDQELVKYNPIVKPEVLQKQIEPSENENNVQKKVLQIENKPTEKEEISNNVEEITPEEERLHDIIKENLNYSINETKFIVNYFKSNVFYNTLNGLYIYFTKQQKNMINDFYKITTNTQIKPNAINLSKTAYNNLVERISIIKTIGDGNCFFEAVSTGINIYNMENLKDKITYANYGIKQIYTIQIIREIVFRYIDNFTSEEKNNLLQIASVLANDLNNIFKNQIDGLELSNEEYIENMNSVYNSSDNFLVYKPNTVPIDVDDYYIPFRALSLNEIERYIKSKDYWANDIAIDAICNILKINIITIEKYNQILRIPYLNFNKNRLCQNKCLFLYYKNHHYDLMRFNYNKQLVQEKDMMKKLLNIKKYYTIFDINKMPPPLHILLLIFGSYYIKLNNENKLRFKFYNSIMDGFDTSIDKKLANLNIKEFNLFTNNFNSLFPGSEERINNLYKKIQDNSEENIEYPQIEDAKSEESEDTELEDKNIDNVGGAISNNINYYGGPNIYKKPESKFAYSITIDMELFPGTTLTQEQLKELKCNSKYNMIRKAYADFMGKPYIIPPVYNKTNKTNKINKNKDNSKTKKNKPT